MCPQLDFWAARNTLKGVVNDPKTFEPFGVAIMRRVEALRRALDDAE
jgi:hypothetical protein